MKILHITSHLGGGIGKALSGLVEQAKISHPSTEHKVVSLEKGIDRQFINKINKNKIPLYIGDRNGDVIECPSKEQLKYIMENVDIVQLEYFNNPVIFKYLCTMDIPPIRLLTWCHHNLLYNPIVPDKLITNSYKFVYTSPCTFLEKHYGNMRGDFSYTGCVFSSGGFKDIPEPKDKIDKNEEISVGYIGSTNFSKMHPNYVDYIASVKTPNFRVKMIGDLHNQIILEQQCNYKGKSKILKFTGFVPDIVEELKSINVLAYLLNPTHYGTTENALLEAMSLQVVPIVLDNPPEKCIVKDNETGFIVHNESEFAETIKYLSENPKERQRIGKNASKFVRENFSVEKTEQQLNDYYQEVMTMEKRKIDFKSIFGITPSEWFLSTQSNKDIFTGNISFKYFNPMLKYGLFEENKGSIFQFIRYFPEDKELKKWSNNINLLR